MLSYLQRLAAQLGAVWKLELKGDPHFKGFMKQRSEKERAVRGEGCA